MAYFAQSLSHIVGQQAWLTHSQKPNGWVTNDRSLQQHTVTLGSSGGEAVEESTSLPLCDCDVSTMQWLIGGNLRLSLWPGTWWWKEDILLQWTIGFYLWVTTLHTRGIMNVVQMTLPALPFLRSNAIIMIYSGHIIFTMIPETQ